MIIAFACVQALVAFLLGANMNLNGTWSRAMGQGLSALALGIIIAAFIEGGWVWGVGFIPGTFVVTLLGFSLTRR